MGPCQPSLGLGYLQGRSSASTTKRGFCFGPTVCVYVCVCDEQEKRENTTELVSLTSHPLQNLYKVGQASNATFGVFCGEESLTSPLGGNVGSPYPRIQKADPEVQWGSGPGETWEKSALLGWGLEEQRPEGRYWQEAPPRWQRRELRTDIKTAWKAASSMDQRPPSFYAAASPTHSSSLTQGSLKTPHISSPSGRRVHCLPFKHPLW